MNYQYKKKIILFNRSVRCAYGRALVKSVSGYNYKSITNITPNDFVMVGYPKSGNTWMQNLLAGILYGVDGSYLPDQLTQELIPDLDYKIFYKRLSKQMVFKTHDKPRNNFKNIIHLVRDPRDVMASYHAMVVGKGGSTSMEKMIKEEDQLLFGTWWDHMKACREYAPSCNMLTVRYEDLVSNTKNELKRIVTFLNIDRHDDLLDRVVEGNSIEEMKLKENKFGFDKRSIQKDKWVEGHSFVRQGKVGSAKKEVPREMLEYIIKKSREYMIDLSYNIEI